MPSHWLHPIMQGKAASLPIPGGNICTFCSSSSSSWGTRATKRGGTFRRGVYLHSIITSLSKHFISRALNRVVLPANQRGHWSHWQLCSFAPEYNPKYNPVTSLKCLHYCGSKKQILEGKDSKWTMLVSLSWPAVRVLVEEVKLLPSERWILKFYLPSLFLFGGTSQ